MFRSARLIVGLCLISGVSIAGIVGWATGFFHSALAVAQSLWERFHAWITSPMSWEHAVAGAGVLIAPLILLAIMFVITDP